ncbi:hypothetical protein BH23ACT12_BH23ACT12_24210 [soil metagenome]
MLAAQRFATLYLPILVVGLLLLWRRPDRRWAGALLLSFGWNMVFILARSRAAQVSGWWDYGVDSPLWLGVPIDLLIGWAALWGPIPALLLPNRPLLASLGVLWFDLLFMPLIDKILLLGDGWPAGELLGTLVCVLPALLLVQWTRERRRLGARVIAQFVLFVGLNSVAVLTVLGACGEWVHRLTGAGQVELALLVQVLAVPGVLAVVAVLEFFRVGRGTPYPYDPPLRLVTTGPYAYVANPMQLAMTLGLGVLAIFFGSVRMGLAAAVAVAYSAGLAAWHEHCELAERFGAPWRTYRLSVRDWILRWRPVAQPEPAELYVAATCPLCSPIGAWIGRRSPVSLRIVPAESLPAPVNRALYLPPEGGTPYRGPAAVAKALEHLNLGWALLGWTMLLPGLRQLIQLLMDALGAGPRTLTTESLQLKLRGIAQVRFVDHPEPPKGVHLCLTAFSKPGSSGRPEELDITHPFHPGGLPQVPQSPGCRPRPRFSG